MCRIAGITSAHQQIGEIKEKVSKMCDVLKHGGPDDEGIYCDEAVNIVLGHRRLSIIDLSSNGHQPMADSGKNCWITFNGEIYNYQTLKEQLLKTGVTFSSNSDTEVIIAAYLQWGTASFDMLRGIFAFALYDKNKAQTYLVRDSAGIKPLYYYIRNKQLSFASEVKALKLSGIANQKDEKWAIRLLAYGHIPEPYTTLKDVFNLPKGHYLKWDHHESSHSIVDYQNHNYKSITINNAGLAEDEIRNSLRMAVKRQLMADAPIGVFLSGGIDSSLVSLLANEQRQKLKTISIYFNEKAYDESAYQDFVRNRIEGEKFVHLVQKHDFEQHFPTILKSMDMPTTDGINTWFISKYAHEDGLKAVLSGIGADELFGGYPSFNRVAYLKYLRLFPAALFKLARFAKPDPLKKIAYLSNDHYIANYLLLRGFFLPADIAKILNTDLNYVNDTLFNENSPESLEGIPYNKEYAAWFESNLYMQNQLLRDTDVMSMSHGLEVRVPFLDEDFRKLVNTISPKIRFNNKIPKKLLIDSFKEILPVETWNRPKMGFTFPLQTWMRENEIITDENHYNNEVSRSLIGKFKTGKMHWSKAFALYQLSMHE